MKLEVAGFSEMLVPFLPTTPSHMRKTLSSLYVSANDVFCLTLDMYSYQDC